MRYDLSVESLSVILNHSLKHSTSFVFGALVGKDGEHTRLMEIQHAIPILHSIPLQPLIEIALNQVGSLSSVSPYIFH